MDERGLILKQLISDVLSDSPMISPDEALRTELERDCLELSRQTEGLSLRGLNRAVKIHCGNLLSEQSRTHQPNVTLTLEDLLSSMRGRRPVVTLPAPSIAASRVALFPRDAAAGSSAGATIADVSQGSAFSPPR